MQAALYKRFGSGYEAAFADAQKYLANPTGRATQKPPAIKFPATSDQLKAAGYEYDSDSTCRGCGAFMEFWITPNGKKMPISIVKVGDPLKTSAELRQPHFSDCPEAKSFRR